MIFASKAARTPFRNPTHSNSLRQAQRGGTR
jgi:hypothetical protein